MQPAGLRQSQFAAIKGEYRMVIDQCETCGTLTSDLMASNTGPYAEPFDPDNLICRCRGCTRKGNTTTIKIRLCDVTA